MDYDVIIVGAGPAGSTAAKFLAEKGIDVLLLDKHEFPRGKACAGGLTPRVLQRFNYIEDHMLESYVFRGTAHSPSSRYIAAYESDEYIAAMVLRENFDLALVNLARDAGATFMNSRVKDVRISDRAEVFLDDGKMDAEVVIGADGVFSTVARKVGLQPDPQSKQIALCILEEFDVGEDVVERLFTSKRVAHIYFLSDGAPGYAWIFPKKDHLNIGLGCARSKLKSNIRELYGGYIQKFKEDGIIPDDIEVERPKIWGVPIRPLRKIYGDRVVLCGDAAGFANPISGEGIYYAMRSGEFAANTISDALRIDDTSEKMLAAYQDACQREFGNRLMKYSSLLRLSMLLPAGATERTVNATIELASKDETMMRLLTGVFVGSLDSRHIRKIIPRILLRVLGF